MKKILYYSAVWCGPCVGFGPIMDSLNGEINVEKIDVDKDRDMVKKYHVKNVPTCILIENGVEKNRFVGIKPRNFVLEFYNS